MLRWVRTETTTPLHAHEKACAKVKRALRSFDAWLRTKPGETGPPSSSAATTRPLSPISASPTP